jgi:hypothetical protein
MSQSTPVSAKRDADLDEAVDGLLDDIFACLRWTELDVPSSFEPPPAPPPGCVWMAGAHRLRV